MRLLLVRVIAGSNYITTLTSKATASKFNEASPGEVKPAFEQIISLSHSVISLERFAA
jgi:hypothetical protein